MSKNAINKGVSCPLGISYLFPCSEEELAIRKLLPYKNSMLLMYSVYLTIHFPMLFYSPFSYAFDGIVPGHGRPQRLDIEPNLRQPHNHIDYIHSMGPI